MWWYFWLKAIHILAAIVAVGANLTYGVWAARARNAPEHLGFALRGIKFIDDRIANPAYGVLLATGLTMWLTTWQVGTRWIISGLILYAIVVVVAVARITPAMRRQLAALDARGPNDPEVQREGTRLQGIGMFASVVVIAIVFVMVFKPSF